MTVVNPNPEQYLCFEDNFLSVEEIKTLIDLGESQSNYRQADVRQADGTYKMIPEYRTNLRGSIDDPALAIAMLEKTKPFLPSRIREFNLVRFHPVFKFYKYNKGDYFNWHSDASVKEGFERSLVTFMIYLTSVGLTEFENVSAVEGKAGRLVVFNHKVKHRSPPLESDDTKIVIRTDVMYKPIYGV